LNRDGDDSRLEPRTHAEPPEELVDDLDLDTRQVSLLKNPNRLEIVRELHQFPGLNKNQIGRRLDLFPNQLLFHLERLQEEDVVTTTDGVRGNEVLCFLETDRDLLEEKSLHILFGQSSTREVGTFVAENPGSSTREIAEAINLTPVTVRHHLRKLNDHGLVERIRVGRSFEYHPLDGLEDCVDRIGTTFDTGRVETGHDTKQGHD
jgi:DNA-binding transcriptional ArsR family regulator